MCGRYTLTSPERAIREVMSEEAARLTPRAGARLLLQSIPARYNVAPTQEMPVVRCGADSPELALLRWGLIPEWSHDPAIASKLINARAETLRDKPSFRAAFKSRRCLVPADGFFEWTAGAKGARQPWWIHAPERQPFAFAGLWENGTFTLVTCEARGAIRDLHDRMPVMFFDRAARAAWLDAQDDATLDRLLEPSAPPMVAYPVSREVNRNDFEDPRAIDAIELPLDPRAAPEPVAAAAPVQGSLFGPEF